KLVDLLHLVELYHRAEMDEGLGPVEILAWSTRRAEEAPRSEEHQFRLETDDDAVKIITVHRSKGLEYPVVFVCTGWEPYDSGRNGRYFYHDGSAVVCDLIHAKDKESAEYARAGEELAAEQLRLLYVALTRASCRVYALGGVSAGYPQSSIAYLLHAARYERRAGESRYAARERFSGLIKDLPFDEIVSDMESFAKKGVIGVTIIPSDIPPNAFRRDSDHPDALVPRKVSRVLRDDWKISSFSYIVSSRSAEYETEYDEDEPVVPETVADDLPKGALVGNCIHEIFESAEFSLCDGEATHELISRTLDMYALRSERVEKWVRDMVVSTLKKKIAMLGTSLSSIPAKRVLREMEFYLPAQRISDREFRDLIASHIDPATFNGGKVRNLSTITFDAFAGFLRGFIDLVVEHDGKYYVADWKSNFLGADRNDYSFEKLCGAMDEHLYTVQALIYSLALDLHLSARLPGYDYDAHFGGAIYLFVRGINPEGNEGIWEYRPSKEMIQAFRARIIRERNDA
ncbi:MAG TPA: 3'-5' exonuclease, partial [Spirochaetota bacterium]